MCVDEMGTKGNIDRSVARIVERPAILWIRVGRNHFRPLPSCHGRCYATSMEAAPITTVALMHDTVTELARILVEQSEQDLSAEPTDPAL